MKILAIVILVVSSVSAKGSGPYLPSGWRPEGPAFFLPSEVARKPTENQLTDTILQSETEASGSESLREYGPPKIVEVSQDISEQSLPELATERAFLIEAKFIQDAETTGIVKEVDNVVTKTEVSLVTEASVEQQAVIEEEIVTVTEEQDVGDIINLRLGEQPLIEGRSIDLEIDASVTASAEQDGLDDITTETAVEQAIQEKSIDLEIQASVAETTEGTIEVTNDYKETAVQEEEKVISEVNPAVEEKALKEVEIKAIHDGVKNIAEAIVRQEESLQLTEARVAEDISGSLAQFPEGFLEYGPPGFREYGPPKGDEVLRTAVEEQPSEPQLLDSNETRRRRFSPKFETSRKH